MDDEVFREVPSTPGYAVSDRGLVLNLKSMRLLTPSITDAGYSQVSITRKGGHRSTKYVHQLMAEAFLEDWRPGVRIGHYDGARANNVVGNLFVMGTPSAPRTHYASPRLNARSIRIEETGEVFRTAYDCAERINGHATNVYAVLRGERRTHRGYTFRYVDNPKT